MHEKIASNNFISCAKENKEDYIILLADKNVKRNK